MKITTLTNPRQTILLTCRHLDQDNVMTLDWHTPLSFDPMMYAVAIAKIRFSCSLVQKSKVFGVNFMSKDFEREVLYCGRHSGKDLDKFKETGLKKEEGEKINCPLIKQALGYLECKVVKEIETGDHILFIAEIVNYELRKKAKRLFHLFSDYFTTTEKE